MTTEIKTSHKRLQLPFFFVLCTIVLVCAIVFSQGNSSKIFSSSGIISNATGDKYLLVRNSTTLENITSITWHTISGYKHIYINLYNPTDYSVEYNITTLNWNPTEAKTALQLTYSPINSTISPKDNLDVELTLTIINYQTTVKFFIFDMCFQYS